MKGTDGTTAATLDARSRDLLREAHAWRLLALLLERPRAGWREEVASLAEGVADEPLAEAARAAASASEGDYLALLGPGGAVSPREAGHRETADPAHVMSEICAYHEAFGFRPASEDPPDHVAVEAAFVGYLRLKEAFALAQGDAGAGEIAAEAARTFVERHLASCAEPIAGGLAARSEGAFALAAKALLARVGPRPANLEGAWAPQGLARVACPGGCEFDLEG